MPKESFIFKAVATTFVILTISVIAGIVTMIIFYKTQISTVKPTPRPTFPSTTTGPPPVMRLPRNLIPDSYTVFLQPDFYTRIIEVENVTSPNQTMLFTGNSTVNFHCVQRTSTIYLHSTELDVDGAVVKNRDTNKKMDVGEIKHKDESSFLEVPLEETLEAGRNYSLFLNFKGKMSKNLDGLYVSSYVEGSPAYEGDENAERFLATTNMEPTEARRVFPCFDEPEMKAVFHVTIIHRHGTTALANAKMKDSSIIDDDWTVTIFDPTQRMSTYLFAFTVSEFKSINSPHERVEIKTFARPEATTAGHTEYAASITGKILEFYENYFDINYSLKKLDQIAVPDLYPLAMENWGLVTYQEGSLLYEEGVSSLLHKEDIATVIAHELAHQWFGNLVTMKWWNDLWLNEGFATYISYFAVDDVEPSFKIIDTFVLTDLHTAFVEDALASSHPLSPPQEDVQSIYEINGMFDSITYCKGALVLRMLADIVDERVFNTGVKRYLRDFRYNNTDRNDFWEYIQKAVDEDGGHTKVAKVMDSWTNQIGYPVLTINTTNGEIYQKHFLYNDSSESSLWWYIPIRVMSNTSDSSLVWLDTSAPVKKDKFLSKSGEWILANVNCTGYYRVNYNPENWERLLTQLETNPRRIPLMNRGQLVDDAFNLARAELVNVTLALNATRFLSNETEYAPWESAVRNLEYFVLMFDRTEVYGPMQAYLCKQVTGLYDFFRNYTENSKVPDDHSLQHNQITAIQVACSSGLSDCVTMASEMFANWMKNSTTNNIFCSSTLHQLAKVGVISSLFCVKRLWLLLRLCIVVMFKAAPGRTFRLNMHSNHKAQSRNRGSCS
uniref:aminopeptidase N-like isoform X2 n=1 Tax=Monopterus albus TaxID=43700 RepID=UPI0009B4812E|nr:aminopeptidase N-like isoform X2 [Monopterus albus]